MDKILFTDLDFTIIKPKGNKRFPKGPNDWVPLEGNVKFIKEYVSKGYKIILVTNQGGIQKGFVKKEDIVKKINLIKESLKLDFFKIVIAESLDSPYRKPKVNKLTEELKSLGINIDKKNSFMIGDAGGRKNDFSDSDYKFAKNLNIGFIHVDDIPILI